MTTIRPNAEPAATTVAAGDVFLIDGATGVRALAASVVPLRDVNGNVSVNSVVEGLTSTATAAGTTTLTAASTAQQVFTGSTTQTVLLPVVSTLQLGTKFSFQNNSTGIVTVNSSGGNLVVTLAPGASATIKCILLTGTTAASWLSNTLARTDVANGGSLTLNTATGGVGYATGAGGAVTQLTSRATAVTLNNPTGAVTLFAAVAVVGTWFSFTVTNSAVAATDVPHVSVKSGTNTYVAVVSAVAAGSFQISVMSIVGTASDSPVLNFVVIKGAAS